MRPGRRRFSGVPLCFNPRTPCGVRRREASFIVLPEQFQSTHSLRSATEHQTPAGGIRHRFNPRTPCGVRLRGGLYQNEFYQFQSTHSLRSATLKLTEALRPSTSFNPRTPCGVRRTRDMRPCTCYRFQSTHSLRSATAPNLIHCYSTKQIILCANLPKKTVIARLLFLSIYLSIFYSQCITPIADLPGNSCELEVGAQAMFNSL